MTSVENILNAQTLVDVTNASGVVKIVLSGGQIIVWPSDLPDLVSGKYYLSLSQHPQTPSKTELAQLVLQEILQLE